MKRLISTSSELLYLLTGYVFVLKWPVMRITTETVPRTACHDKAEITTPVIQSAEPRSATQVTDQKTTTIPDNVNIVEILTF